MKIKINDKIKLVLDVEQELSISEFVAVSGIVNKIDKYSFNIKKEISGLVKKTNRRKQMSDKDKRVLINEWSEADKKEKQKIAERQGASLTQMSYRIHYYKKTLNGGV